MFAGLYAAGGVPWLIWGGFVRSVLVLHTTWLVNSATHIWGYRTYATRDQSTNLWWVALLTFGEGWHNNHHAFPTSAKQGLRWWELDMTYLAIRVLAALGLVHRVKLPPAVRRKNRLDRSNSLIHASHKEQLIGEVQTDHRHERRTLDADPRDIDPCRRYFTGEVARGGA